MKAAKGANEFKRKVRCQGGHSLPVGIVAYSPDIFLSSVRKRGPAEIEFVPIHPPNRDKSERMTCGDHVAQVSKLPAHPRIASRHARLLSP
jgi:hypothetical protein